jgi:hypothetical protein
LDASCVLVVLILVRLEVSEKIYLMPEFAWWAIVDCSINHKCEHACFRSVRMCLYIYWLTERGIDSMGCAGEMFFHVQVSAWSVCINMCASCFKGVRTRMFLATVQ